MNFKFEEYQGAKEIVEEWEDIALKILMFQYEALKTLKHRPHHINNIKLVEDEYVVWAECINSYSYEDELIDEYSYVPKEAFEVYDLDQYLCEWAEQQRRLKEEHNKRLAEEKRLAREKKQLDKILKNEMKERALYEQLKQKYESNN